MSEEINCDDFFHQIGTRLGFIRNKTRSIKRNFRMNPNQADEYLDLIIKDVEYLSKLKNCFYDQLFDFLNEKIPKDDEWHRRKPFEL